MAERKIVLRILLHVHVQKKGTVIKPGRRLGLSVKASSEPKKSNSPRRLCRTRLPRKCEKVLHFDISKLFIKMYLLG